MSHRNIQVSDLRRVHDLTAQHFPHEYLDTGLGAIGLFLHDPPKNAGYRTTPLNSVTFASTGIDGIHFGSITDEQVVDTSSPVVLTIPMAFESPNYIVGSSLYDFLCLGCRHGFSNLGNLQLDFEATMEHYENQTGDFYDERAPAILQMMSDELSLTPWSDVRGHFLDLQSQFMSMLRFPTEFYTRRGIS